MKKQMLLLFLCLCGGFLANAQVINSVLPSQNPINEGGDLTVVISGSSTNFAQGSSIIVFVNVGGTMVSGYVTNIFSNTLMSVYFPMPCGICGNATLSVLTPIDGLMSYSNSFDVTCAQITGVSPNSISSGQTLSIGISGQGIDFSQGSSIVYFTNPTTGQTLYPSSYNGSTANSVNVGLYVPSNFSCSGTYDACIYTSTGCQVCLPNVLTVNGTGQPPQINSVNPGSAVGGQALTVNISGSNINFLQGSGLFFQLYNSGSGAIVNGYNYNPSSQTQIAVNFNMPNSCGSYDLVFYGADPCSNNPVVYNNALMVTSTLNPQLAAVTPNTGATMQALTLNLTGAQINFTQLSSSLFFRLVHVGTGATLMGTNLTTNGSNNSMATIDFYPLASDCGLYDLMIDSVSTGCSDVTTVVYSNAVTINSSTNAQLQAVSPDTSSLGQTVYMVINTLNLDFNLVSLADLYIYNAAQGMYLYATGLTPNPGNPNMAFVNFNIPNGSMYCGFYDVIINNIVGCGQTSITLINGFEVVCNTNTDLVGRVEDELRLLVFPNPMDNQATVKVTSSEDQVLNFQLYDMLGKAIRREEMLSNTSFTLEREHLPAGVYLYRLSTLTGEVLKSGKLELR